MAEDSSHFMVPSWAIASAILVAILMSRFRVPNAGLVPYGVILIHLFGRDSPASAIILAGIWGMWCSSICFLVMVLSRLVLGMRPIGPSVWKYAHLGVYLPFLVIARPGIHIGATPGPIVANAMTVRKCRLFVHAN